LLVNAFTGDVIGEGSPRLRAFFRVVTDWHRWLARAGDSRAIGRTVTGACNLAFLFLILSGAYLWIPRRWSWAALKATTVPRLGLAGKARDWNWHNALAFWAAMPLLVIVVSGVVMSYPWANDLLYRAVGSAPPAQRGPGEPREDARRRVFRDERPDGSGGSSAQVVLDVAMQREPDWTSITHDWPPVRDGKVTVNVGTGTGGQPQRKTQLTIDAATLAVIKSQGWREMETGRKTRSILRFAHTGEILGRAGQAIAGVASLAAVVLVYSGFALSVRRFTSRD
jgi:uncharacterized iron-regulated membrane protein